MADPLTLSVLAGVVLSEGVKFLYRQAEEMVKASKERRAAAREDAEPTVVEVPAVPTESLEEPPPTQVDAGALERATDRLAQLAEPLAPYARDEVAVDANDTAMLATAEELRGLLEALYGRSLTFRTETDEAGARVRVGQTVGDITGEATALDADEVGSGADVDVEQRTGTVEEGGTARAARIGRIGGRRR